MTAAAGILGVLLVTVPAAVALASPPVPANDACASALPIVTLPFLATEPGMALATADPADPVPSCTGGHAHHTLWFRYDARATGSVNVTTRTSWRDSFLWVGKGTCGSLAPIACNDDAASFFNATVEFQADAGETYYVLAGAYFPLSWGQLAVIAERGVPLATPPANDLCAAATPITAIPQTLRTPVFGAREEPGDVSPPCWPGAVRHTIWYTLASPVDRQVRVDTTDSTEETWLTVLTGACGSLAPVDCDHDSGVNARGVVDFLARAGVTYHLQVSRVFPPSPGELVELAVRDGESFPLTVHVTRADDGRDVAGAHVSIRDVWGGFYLIREGWTDARGEVTLFPPYVDTFHAQVMAPGYVVNSWVFENAAAGQTDIALAPMPAPPVPPVDLTRVVLGTDQGLVTFLSDGSDVREIVLPAFGQIKYPTWSPDAARIGFEGWQPGGAHEIWIVNADGSGLLQLTHFDGDPGRQENLAWSPDGKQFAFDWVRPWALGPSVHVVDAKTGTQLEVLADDAEDPTWSPDSSMIAYVNGGGVRAMRRDGSHNVTMTGAAATSVDWSADGSRVAISGGNESIWTIGVDGRGALKVADTQSNYATQRSWSPDGCELVYVDRELGLGYVNRAAADGGGFATTWRGYTWSDPDWAAVAGPGDVPGDRAPRVDLLDPDGGELAPIGAVYDIRWTASDDQGIVAQDLYLITAAGRTPIALGLAGGIDRHAWTVPGQPAEVGAWIEVVVRDASGQEHRDTSRYPFSIAGATEPYAMVRLLTPHAGESFNAGDVVRIAWESDVRSSSTPDGFHLELSLDGGFSYRVYIDDFLTPEERAYDWTVPEYTSGRAVIRIRQGGAYDETGPITLDGFALPLSPAGRLTLYGVRNGGDAVLGWVATPGRSANAHRTDAKLELPGVWAQAPLGTSGAGRHVDPEPAPGAGRPWYYQVFPAACNGRSLP